MSIRDVIRKKKNRASVDQGGFEKSLFYSLEQALGERLNQAIKDEKDGQVAKMKGEFQSLITDLAKTTINFLNQRHAEIKKAYEESDSKVSSFRDSLQTISEAEKERHREVLLELIQPVLEEFSTMLSTKWNEFEDRAEELRGADGEKGEPGVPGANGSPDLPEEIAAKLNTTEESVEQSVISGLLADLEELRGQIRSLASRKSSKGGGGGMSNWVDKAFSGDGSTTEFTLDYRVAGNSGAIIVVLNGQVQEMTTHYSISGKTVTFTTAPFDGAFIYMQYARA